jgi:hypothetical protein
MVAARALHEELPWCAEGGLRRRSGFLYSNVATRETGDDDGRVYVVPALSRDPDSLALLLSSGANAPYKNKSQGFWIRDQWRDWVRGARK